MQNQSHQHADTILNIFGKLDLEAIRNYSIVGRNIPPEFLSVLTMLEKENRELRSSDFLNRITMSSRKWQTMENDIVFVTKALCKYGKEAIEISDKIVSKINAMPIMQKIKNIGKGGDLSSEDKKICAELSVAIAKMLKNATENQYSVRRVSGKIEEYRLKMENEILPQAAMIKLIIIKMPDLSICVNVGDKKYEIRVPNGSFLKNRPIAANIFERLLSAATVASAEEAMEDANNFIRPIEKALELTCLNIDEIFSAIVLATSATQEIEIFWDKTAKNLEQIKYELDNVNDDAMLLAIQNRLKTVTRSWQIIVESENIFMKSH